jgi:hypothetical protein
LNQLPAVKKQASQQMVGPSYFVRALVLAISEGLE